MSIRAFAASILTLAASTAHAVPPPPTSSPDPDLTAPRDHEPVALALFAPPPTATPPPTPSPAPTATPTAPLTPVPPKTLLDGWKGNVEFGANGSSGNSDNFSFRGGVGAKRLTDTLETAARLDYSYATSDGRRTKDRGQLEVRNDWHRKDSKWSIFALGRAEYDELQDWNWRLSLFVGPGYTFIKNDTTLLRGRVGAGITKELGGSRNDLLPEALVGVDYEYRLNKNTKLFATGEAYPSLKDVAQYRALARVGVEVLLDEDAKLTLKLGAENRYQSQPGLNKKKDDLDYFALVSFNF